MKRIVTLIIFSIIMKSLIGDCVKNGDNWEWDSSETESCLLVGENCIVKTLCELKENPAEDGDCEGIETPNPTAIKCVLDESSCKVKTLCELKENPTKDDDCEGIETPNPSKTKCILSTGKCEIKNRECNEFIDAININNEEDCISLTTTNPMTLKCVLKTGGSCKEENKKCSEIKNGEMIPYVKMRQFQMIPKNVSLMKILVMK